MNDRIGTQREAVRRGLQLRRSLSIPREHPVNVFDVASSIGVEVQFLDLPSLEGMFYRGPDPKVILPSLKHRPRGRVAFSCAHELGHFDLGHGTQVDKYVGEDDDRRPGPSLEELAADTFASTFLMPRPAVLARFSCRGWMVDAVSALDLYRVAAELDVGYGTLCKHLRYGLQLVNDTWMKSRAKFAPKALRAAIAPRSECPRLVVLDEHWPKLPVELEVGDCLAVPTILRAKLPSSLRQEYEHDGRRILRAAVPGEMKAVVNDQLVTIRIARAGYCGMLKYRYLEEGEDE
ncbi:MAG TPA: ImmA/IrrE family metallo-endopeptidase [Pirellulales bacterium]|nr:ImmA/IrrE family metallo-endopeptidase [Pirellulales bacterium]